MAFEIGSFFDFLRRCVRANVFTRQKRLLMPYKALKSDISWHTQLFDGRYPLEMAIETGIFDFSQIRRGVRAKACSRH